MMRTRRLIAAFLLGAAVVGAGAAVAAAPATSDGQVEAGRSWRN